MDINKAKVLIYLLTFACYAWSGYGSSLLGNLRDLVLATEGVFGDFFNKFTDVVTKLKHVHDGFEATISEDCNWSCPDGAKAKPNKYYKAQSNGCGPQGMKVGSDAMPFEEMTKCCDNHDICYGTCGKDKVKCDEDFKKCLYKICDQNKSDPLTDTGCKTAAKVLYTATTALGCKFYQDSQSEACYCPPTKKKYSSEL